jgi:hypothetical protein
MAAHDARTAADFGHGKHRYDEPISARTADSSSGLRLDPGARFASMPAADPYQRIVNIVARRQRRTKVNDSGETRNV